MPSATGSSGLFLAIDLIVGTGLLFLLLRFSNSRRGLLYLSCVVASLAGLILTAYLPISGLHLLFKVFFTLFVIGLPVFFFEQWQGLFSFNPTSQTINSGYLPPAILILVAIIVSGLFLFVGSGGANKIDGLPQQIDISAVNLPEGVAANLGSAHQVSIVVSAPRAQWRSLSSDNFSATVDVAGQKEGTYDLAVNVSSKLSDAHIVRVTPAKVVVTVEPVIRKTVPVVTKFTGLAGDELVPGTPTITPDKVEVSGAKSLITDVREGVLQVRLNGDTKTIDQKLAVVALGANGEPVNTVSFSPAEVQVSIPLVKAGKLKTVGVRPVITGQVAGGNWIKEVTVNPGVISLTGTADLLDKTTEVTTQPITVAGLTADSEIEVGLNVPSGLVVADQTKTVKVKVSLTKASTTKTVIPTLTYDETISPALKVTVLDPTNITAIISGGSADLAGVSDGSIKVKIDLSAYKTPGTYTITMKITDFTLPANVSLVSFLPSAISVTLESK